MRLKRLQVFNQIILLLPAQIQSLEAVVVFDHIQQSGKPTVVIKATLHMRKQPAQGCGAIGIVGGAISLEVVNADLRCLVRIPTRFSEERRNVTLRTSRFAVEDYFTSTCCCSIETASWWCG